MSSKRPPPENLLTDPHFLFTILSLCISLSVFFYYLYQLLCNSHDWADHGDGNEEGTLDDAAQRRMRARRNAEIERLVRQNSDAERQLRDELARVKRAIATHKAGEAAAAPAAGGTSAEPADGKAASPGPAHVPQASGTSDKNAAPAVAAAAAAAVAAASDKGPKKEAAPARDSPPRSKKDEPSGAGGDEGQPAEVVKGGVSGASGVARQRRKAKNEN